VNPAAGGHTERTSAQPSASNPPAATGAKPRFGPYRALNLAHDRYRVPDHCVHPALLTPAASDAVASGRIAIKNTHATDALVLGPSNVTAADGFALTAGATIELDLADGDLVFGIRGAAADKLRAHWVVSSPVPSASNWTARPRSSAPLLTFPTYQLRGMSGIHG
jgi:hypothetical protein